MFKIELWLRYIVYTPSVLQHYFLNENFMGPYVCTNNSFKQVILVQEILTF